MVTFNGRGGWLQQRSCSPRSLKYWLSYALRKQICQVLEQGLCCLMPEFKVTWTSSFPTFTRAEQASWAHVQVTSKHVVCSLETFGVSPLSSPLLLYLDNLLISWKAWWEAPKASYSCTDQVTPIPCSRPGELGAAKWQKQMRKSWLGK